jgi:hypothetical protein
MQNCKVFFFFLFLLTFFLFKKRLTSCTNILFNIKKEGALKDKRSFTRSRVISGSELTNLKASFIGQPR